VLETEVGYPIATMISNVSIPQRDFVKSNITSGRWAMTERATSLSCYQES